MRLRRGPRLISPSRSSGDRRRRTGCSASADAARILRLLSGRTHRVITGVALVTAERTQVASEVTAVKFLTLSEEEIAAYIATGEPMDKAGAYAIQGRAARWIPRIEGDYFNVVGLPIAIVSTLLESLAPSQLL